MWLWPDIFFFLFISSTLFLFYYPSYLQTSIFILRNYLFLLSIFISISTVIQTTVYSLHVFASSYLLFSFPFLLPYFLLFSHLTLVCTYLKTAVGMSVRVPLCTVESTFTVPGQVHPGQSLRYFEKFLPDALPSGHSYHLI